MIVWEPGASSYGVISAQKLLAAFRGGACCMNRALYCAPLLPRCTLRTLRAACCASFRPRYTLREPRSILRVFPTAVNTARTTLYVARLSYRGVRDCANRFKFHMSRTVFFIFHTMLLVTITYSIHSIALRPVMKNVSSDTVGSHKARQ